MMTSSNGNIFRATVPLPRESTGHHWIPLTHTNASDAKLWGFFAIRLNGWTNNRDAGDFRHHPHHYDVTVMWQSPCMESNPSCCIAAMSLIRIKKGKNAKKKSKYFIVNNWLNQKTCSILGRCVYWVFLCYVVLRKQKKIDLHILSFWYTHLLISLKTFSTKYGNLFITCRVVQKAPYLMFNGVRQGDPLSPTFSACISMISSSIWKKMARLSVENLAINCLLYANDMVIIAEKEGQLQINP